MSIRLIFNGRAVISWINTLVVLALFLRGSALKAEESSFPAEKSGKISVQTSRNPPMPGERGMHETVSLPEASQNSRAEGPKYRHLLRVVNSPNDAKNYGDYYDWGYWSGHEWAGQKNLPAGYWVYITPNWHIFEKTTESISSNQFPPQAMPPHHWGPEEAVGPPDTSLMGDYATAWASRTADDEDEWLRLDYDRPIIPMAVHVYETLNPGALSRITATKADGTEVEIWKGVDPSQRNTGVAVAKINVKADFPTQRITIYLKSKQVSGWNEIDAVGLMDQREQMHWAVRAEASSTYAESLPMNYSGPLELRVQHLESEHQQLRQKVQQLERQLRQAKR
jgi:hypothetical protein